MDPIRVTKLITPKGRDSDGHTIYTVHLYDVTKGPLDVDVDDEMFQLSSGSYLDPIDVGQTTTAPVLWPYIVEKAVAVKYGSYEKIYESEADQIELLTGHLIKVGFPGAGAQTAQQNLVFETNLKAWVKEGVACSAGLQDLSLAPAAAKAYQKGDYACTSFQNQEYCLAMEHAYTVLAFDGTTVTLRNPWGENRYGVGAQANGVLSMPVGAFELLSPITTYEDFTPYAINN